MVKEFADAVVKMEKGQFTTTPVQTQFGWHVIQLVHTRPAQLPPLDQVQDRVKQLVQRKKVAAHLQELRKESKLDPDKLTTALTEYATTPKAPEAPAAAPAEAPVEAPAAPAGN